MNGPLQVTVGNHVGIDVLALVRAIEQGYQQDGHAVRVRIGQGQVIDGLPPGFIYIEGAPQT